MGSAALHELHPTFPARHGRLAASGALPAVNMHGGVPLGGKSAFLVPKRSPLARDLRRRKGEQVRLP
jgi:hypothetical protein